MPSPRHEGALYALHDQPELALHLLAGRGVEIPEYDALHVDSANLPDLVPTDFRADAVITLWREGEALLSIVVEVQNDVDEDKPWVWPAYLANLRARRRCGVLLLVVCFSARVAARCARPIRLGQPGWILTPTVIGPAEIPKVTDGDEARARPGLAVLSALAHPTDTDVLAVLPEALALRSDAFRDYYLLIEAALPAASRRFLEDRVATAMRPFKAEWLNDAHEAGYLEGEAEGEERGRAEGMASAVLDVLAARQIRLTSRERLMIANCRDHGRLTDWLRRAVVATSVDDLPGVRTAAQP